MRRTSSRARRAQVDAAEPERPGQRVDEAQQQRGEGALARAGGTDDADPAAARHRDRQSRQGGVTVPAGGHVDDLDGAVGRRRDGRAGRLDRGRKREQRVDPVLRGAGAGRGGAGVDDWHDDLPQRHGHEDQQGGDRRAEVTRRRRSARRGARRPRRRTPQPTRASSRPRPSQQALRTLPRASSSLGLGDRDDRAFARLPHHAARRRPEWSRRRARTAGPGRRRCPARSRAAPTRVTSVGQAADQRRSRPRPRRPGGRGRRRRPWPARPRGPARGPASGCAAPGRGRCRRRRRPREDVATPRTETPGRERYQRVVHLGAAAGQHAEGGVVGEQPLGVPQHRTGQTEGPDQRRSRPAGSARPDGSRPARSASPRRR